MGPTSRTAPSVERRKGGTAQKSVKSLWSSKPVSTACTLGAPVYFSMSDQQVMRSSTLPRSPGVLKLDREMARTCVSE